MPVLFYYYYYYYYYYLIVLRMSFYPVAVVRHNTQIHISQETQTKHSTQIYKQTAVAYGVVRCRGFLIVQTIGSQMAALYPQESSGTHLLQAE
jgi:hypothetical protein